VFATKDLIVPEVKVGNGPAPSIDALVGSLLGE